MVVGLIVEEMDCIWLLIFFLCGKKDGREGLDVELSFGLDCDLGLVVEELDWNIWLWIFFSLGLVLLLLAISGSVAGAEEMLLGFIKNIPFSPGVTLDGLVVASAPV